MTKINIRKQLFRGVLVTMLAAMAMAIPSLSSGAIQKDAVYGTIPLFFIPNNGKVDSQVSFYIQGNDKSVYFTAEGLTFTMTDQTEASPER